MRHLDMRQCLTLLYYFCFVESQEQYMQRCLDLAAKGLGYTASNPLVGAVIVHEGRIIGEGYHMEYGGPHAEVNAVNAVSDKSLLAESTIYVSLEPCAHHGKTPPCCDLLIQHQFKKVVIAMQDPFPKVDGEGIRRMKEAGMEIEIGVLEQKAREQNKRFLTFHEKKRPFIVLKWMQSEDGFTGRRGEKLAISNAFSSRMVHRWRGEEMGILIGPETAMNDNPSLSNRSGQGKNPERILLDRMLRVSHHLQLFTDDEPLWILNTVKEGKEGKLTYLKVSDENFLEAGMSRLYAEGIVSILVEGGTQIHNAMLKEKLWDEIRVGVSPAPLREGVEAPHWPGVTTEEFEVEGDSWYIFR